MSADNVWRVLATIVLTLLMLGGVVGSCAGPDAAGPAAALSLAVLCVVGICALDIGAQLGNILTELKKWGEVGKVEETKDGKG